MRDHVRMRDDQEQRTDAGQAILESVGGLTPGEARKLAIRHSDAFSPERQAARVQARRVARDLGLTGALDALIRAAAGLPDLAAVPERSQDAVRQVITDAAVVALLDEDLAEEPRTLLAAPWMRATRRRRAAATARSGAVTPVPPRATRPVAATPAAAAAPEVPPPAPGELTLFGAPGDELPAILVLGRDSCGDTVRSVTLLRDRAIPHVYRHVDQDAEADAWIRRLNGGEWRTPTILIGDPDAPEAILREPSDPELLAAIGLD